MAISEVTLQPNIYSKRKDNFPNQARKALKPIQDFIVEKPLATGGTLLTFAAFISSLFSFSRSLSLIPVFGLPAIGLFICQIFYPSTTGNNNSDNKVRQLPKKNPLRIKPDSIP